MHAYAPNLSLCSRPRCLLWVFLPVSLLLHALVVILWTGEPPSGMTGGGVLQVRLEPRAATGADGDRRQESVTPLSGTKPQERKSKVVAEPVSRLRARVDVSPKPQSPVASKAPATADTKLASRASTNRRAVVLGKQSRNRRAQPQPSAEPAPVGETREDTDSEAAAIQPLASESSVTGSGQGRPASAPGASPSEGERGGMGGDTYRMVQTALRKALLARFDYPLLARRRGWEGRVRIALLVEPDGDLTDLQVVQSSGYQVLDEAALEGLREVGQLPQADVWLGGKALAVVLPVQYRLQ